MSLKQNSLLLFILVHFLACQNSKNGDRLNSSLEEKKNSEMNSIIKDMNTFFEVRANTKVLIIPIDVSCPACRDKCLNWIAAQTNLPKSINIILTGNNPKDIQKVILEKKLSEKQQIYIDSQNYCFLKNIAFVKPVIYTFDKNKSITKIELTPINIDKELSKL